MKYRALTGLTLPANTREAERIRKAREAGAPIPFEERRLVRVEAGEVAEFIPDVSLGWLLEQRLVEPVEEEGG
jgi:hypothetical protein